MRMTRVLLCVPLALVMLVALPLYAATSSESAKPSVDPKAKELLKQMSDYLSSLTSFSVHAETTREVVLPSAQELDSNQTFDLQLQRPDRVHATMRSAAGEKHFFYDGKNVTIYTPRLKYYTVFPAPSTIDAMFQEAAAKYKIEMPAADLLCSDPYKAMTKGVISAIYVGESLIDSTNCHQLAFRHQNIDWQIWIEQGDTPLPMKFVITDRTAKGSPRFTAVLSDWDTSPTFDSSTFTFVPAEDDKKIDILRARELKGKQLLKKKTPQCP